MRRVIYVIFILCSLKLSAQPDKNYLLRTNFGYSFSHLDGADANNDFFGNSVYGEKGSDFNYNINGGKKLKSNFYFGLGLLHNIKKQEINPDSDITDVDSNSGVLISYINSVTTENTISPFVFIQYFINITDRFSIAFDLYSKYDFNKSTTNYILYYPDITNHIYVNNGEMHTEAKKEYLSFGVLPSLRFNIIKNFGLDFTFGIMEYRLKTQDSRVDNPDNKSSEFKIGFKPENWLIGFYLKM